MSSRKKFLYQSSLLLGGGMMAAALDNNVFAIFKNRIAPSDQLNIGAIGIKGMGWSNVMAALKVPGVNIVALCDIDKNVLDQRLSDLTKMNIDVSKIKTYGDYRKLLDQKDV